MIASLIHNATMIEKKICCFSLASFSMVTGPQKIAREKKIKLHYYYYKQAIRQVAANFELTNEDGINSHLANKYINSFWKCWNLKYQKATSAAVAVNGTSAPGLIANAFKDHFANSFINSHDDTRAKTEFEKWCQTNDAGHSEALPVILSLEYCIKSLSIGELLAKMV